MIAHMQIVKRLYPMIMEARSHCCLYESVEPIRLWVMLRTQEIVNFHKVGFEQCCSNVKIVVTVRGLAYAMQTI